MRRLDVDMLYMALSLRYAAVSIYSMYWMWSPYVSRGNGWARLWVGGGIVGSCYILEGMTEWDILVLLLLYSIPFIKLSMLTLPLPGQGG